MIQELLNKKFPEITTGILSKPLFYHLIKRMIDICKFKASDPGFTTVSVCSFTDIAWVMISIIEDKVSFSIHL